MIEEKTREIVRQKLSQYLEAKKLRKTPERYAILDKIYATSEHFDVDLLYEMMSESEYRVSRATVYNTIDLLVDAGLVRKHQFETTLPSMRNHTIWSITITSFAPVAEK